MELERTRFTSVWLDDRRVGDHQSLGCPQVFDLSGMAKPGRHVLTIRVDNRPRRGLGAGHMFTDHTQVNWNGILGKIELRATDPVWIENANIRPELATRSVRVKLNLGNRTGNPAVAAVALAARSTTAEHRVPTKETEVTIPPGGTAVEIHYPLGDGALVWDEFTPHLYEMTIKVSSGDFADEDIITFGLREFGRAGTQFTINGRRTFLRGKHDALVWPLTGHAPMDVAAWERVMRIAKDYGINHYRFHSCTPPAAAFIAADRVGIYVQPELYHFGGDLSRHPEGIRYAKEEGRRILDTYGNHPSFVMMTLGNEMRDGREARAGVIRELRAFDPSRLYAQASNYDFRNLKLEPGDDYWTTIRTAPGAEAAVRGSFSHADLPLGHIQVNPPSTMYDFSAAIRNIPVPVIGHETGQFQVYPDFSEVSKYTGAQKPWNFEVFAERLRKAGMFDQRDAFVRASGALAVLCYREDIEAALRTPGFGGFHLLDLQDFPGQGTALVGILDAFMDSKGLITPEQWREFCSPVVPLARIAKYTWVSGEAFNPQLEIANYGAADLDDRTLRVRLSVDGGGVLDEVSLPLAAAKSGEVSEVATLDWKLPSLEKAAKLSLVLEVPGTEIRNTYPLWVYPPAPRPEPPAGIRVLRKMDAEVMKALGQGESVLLIPGPDPGSNSVEGFFASDFWCFPMFRQIATSNGKEVAPGTLGILCDPAHPALAGFPTEFHSNWQWWQLVMHSRPVILDATPPSFRPVVQVIDNFERNHKLGLVFECTVGKGRLLVCAIDLPQLMEHPEARRFYASLLDYMGSPAFAPETALEPAGVAALFAPRGKQNGGGPTIDYSEFFNIDDSKDDR